MSEMSNAWIGFIIGCILGIVIGSVVPWFRHSTAIGQSAKVRLMTLEEVAEYDERAFREWQEMHKTEEPK